MKPLLLTFLVPVVLAGCTSKADPTPDPFLGQWQADSVIFEEVDASGKVLTPSKNSPQSMKLRVTATTMQFSAGTGINTVTGAPISYTRKGEVLTLNSKETPCCGLIKRTYVRSLTADTFTYEITNTSPDGSIFIIRHPYHR